jgi:hypothetical protein
MTFKRLLASRPEAVRRLGWSFPSCRFYEELREEPTYVRNIHLTVLSNMIEKAEGEAERLGLEICKAMVLATQSEDDKLEAFAYQCFNRLNPFSKFVAIRVR